MNYKKIIIKFMNCFLLLISLFVFSITYAKDYKKCFASISSTSTNDDYFNSQWGLAAINAPTAWDTITSASSVRVAVIDTGVDITHVDIAANLNSSLSYSVVDDTGLTDNDGHGTHVAGIIGAIGNNHYGISGVCWSVDIVSIKVDQDGDNITETAMASAINYAESIGADIINFSISWESFDYMQSVYNAISNFSGLFVCAAGNSGADIDDYGVSYPSNYSLNNIISVGSINIDGSISGFSNYGVGSVDLFAPGGGILSLYPEDIYNGVNPIGYNVMSGTSMATPFVSGAAALIWAKNPNLTVAQLKSRILNNVTIKTGFDDYCVSGGVLNLAAAL